MFVLIWRRSGIVILFYIAISFWIVGYWFKDHSDNNSPYIGWSLFYAAIATLLHALVLIGGRNPTAEEDASTQTDDTGAEEEPQERGTVWSHSLFYIPVVFWPLILGGISAYQLIPRSEKGKEVIRHSAPAPQVKAEKRIIHFLNATADSMILRVDDPHGKYEQKVISPFSFVTRKYDAGKYNIIAANLKKEIIFEIPSKEIIGDKSKSVALKDDNGKLLDYRILRPATKSTTDYDDAWISLGGEHNMLLVDVSMICSETVTKKDIQKIDWTKNIVATYNGRDLIEPMYGKDPGDGSYTILDTGADIPQTINKKEHVYVLLSTRADADITSEYIMKKILERVVVI